MAKAKGRKLKVFQAQFGFYDTVVAAPSRAAAMRAWGVRQNIFADGTAKEITEKLAVAAAIAFPETVLKRPLGSNAAFELDPVGLPQVPDAPKRKVPRSKKTSNAEPVRPPPDRSALDAAETALGRLDERRKAEERELDAEQAALDAKRSQTQDAYVRGRKAATSAVVSARKAYRDDGGRD